MSGSINHNERLYFRTRNGKTHAYYVTSPYEGPASVAQNTMRKNFASCVREASKILNDTNLRSEWETRYANYCKNTPEHQRTCSTLRGFIISNLYKTDNN